MSHFTLLHFPHSLSNSHHQHYSYHQSHAVDNLTLTPYTRTLPPCHSYGMFASLSTVMKEDLKDDLLQAIVIQMLEALQTDEGVKVHYDEPNAGGLFDFNNIDDDDGDDDDDDDEHDLDDTAAIKGLVEWIN